MTKEERVQKFDTLLFKYFRSELCINEIARHIGISEATGHKWFNDWCLGLRFTEVPKDKYKRRLKC